MNRRPIIPVRSFKTDDYGTSLAIGPKATPPRKGQGLRDTPYEKYMKDKQKFRFILETIKDGNIELFKKNFPKPVRM